MLEKLRKAQKEQGNMDELLKQSDTFKAVREKDWFIPESWLQEAAGYHQQQFELKTSPGDRNEYDMFILDNGIHVLLIQDYNHNEEANDDTVAYCSFAVNVGSYNDPPNRPGLAHFLEHMIFMGSEKFQEEDAYQAHISSFGGYSNAYTELEWTNYHFEIPYGGLEKALEMQAHNFIAPLFFKGAIEREIEAIDNEFKRSIHDDTCRLLQILIDQTNKNHTFNGFMWGNIQSLLNKKNLEDPTDPKELTALWEDMKKFYKENVSADRCKLVISCKT